MAAQARIVLFSWVWTPKAAQLDSPHPAPSKWAMRPPSDRHDLASRRVATGLVGWRVRGANNRGLGRRANPARRLAQAYLAVQAAQLTFGSACVRGVAAKWLLVLAHVAGRRSGPVSSRGYQRQRECDYSLEHFRTRFPSAEVVTPPINRFRPVRPYTSGTVGLGGPFGAGVLVDPGHRRVGLLVLAGTQYRRQPPGTHQLPVTRLVQARAGSWPGRFGSHPRTR